MVGVRGTHSFETRGRTAPEPLRRGEPVKLGALVEIEDGETGKTLFLAPVGAGMELTGRVRHTVLAGEPVVIDAEAQR